MNPPPSREEAILEAAAALSSPEERAALLERECAGDSALRARVESLLKALDQAGGSFLGAPIEITEGADLPVRKSPDGKNLPVTEKAGDTIGRYKLLQPIGEGGCGVVYMAEQSEPVRRRVALKVIKLGMDTKQVVARFEAERQALALMDHPNIAKVLDAGSTDAGRPYFVMELVRGTRITDFCDHQKLPMAERLGLFIQVCSAIQHAHQKGIIHRDLKPSNVLVTLHDGVPVPKVIDFGIAKATTDQRLTDKTLFTAFEQFIGTPAYMSPEQAEMSGLDIDTRSDIYSLGVLLYELLTGKTPFDARELLRSGMEGIRKTLRDREPAKPSVRLSTLAAVDLTSVANARHAKPPTLIHALRGDLDWIVLKCLEKDRARRYETANGLAADLKRHLENEPVVARPPSSAYRFQKLVRRNKVAFAAVAAVSLILLVGIVASVWQAVRATRAEALATERLGESEKARQDAKAISEFMTGMFESTRPGNAKGGREVRVADILDAAVEKLETELADQPERRARLQATLGGTYYALGLYPQAITLQQKVRDYHLAKWGPEHADTLLAMHNLATSYHNVGRRIEALKMREEVLALFRKTLGSEHPETLWAMGSLANSYNTAGRREEALKMREESLEHYRKVRGPEHPDTLRAMNNLAISYITADRREEALQLRDEALAHYRKVRGLEHPDTLWAMQELAFSFYDTGRTAEALKLREEVLALRRKVQGPEHPDTLKAMGILGDSYDDAGRKDEALQLREELLVLRRKTLNPAHPDTLKLREELLALRRKALGSEHPDTLTAMGFLAFSYHAAGRKDEALKLREDVLALRRKELGAEHPETLRAMDNLAYSYHTAGRKEEALKLREAWLPLSRKVLGADHPDTLQAMENLASSYQAAGRNDEAQKLREEKKSLQVRPDSPKP